MSVQLYKDLLALCEGEKTPFYFKDFPLLGEFYRVFSYHAAIPRDFACEASLESRGIMFQTNNSGEYIRIASRPMQKFFNRGEHPKYDIDGSIEVVMDKVDGSLMSTFLTGNGHLDLKSKTSLNSDHANLSRKILEADNFLYGALEDLELSGYTVNMEFVTPDPRYRIVLHYDKHGLIVLNARHRETGEYLPRGELERLFGDYAYRYLVGLGSVEDLVDFKDQKGIEGYVVIDEFDQWAKLKTPWYIERHRAKDFINRPIAFIELVIKEEIDDVMALLDQEEVRKQAEEWIWKVTRKMNGIINRVTRHYRQNKSLSRKDFAIKSKSALSNDEFSLAMMYYAKGEEPDWNDFFLRRVKKIDWGIA